ncbi:hypothetical protein Hanom_Chr05g00435461 [Helianthus anomalus]
MDCLSKNSDFITLLYALDKIRIESLVHIIPNKASNTLSIIDGGGGTPRLVNNLGTVTRFGPGISWKLLLVVLMLSPWRITFKEFEGSNNSLGSTAIVKICEPCCLHGEFPGYQLFFFSEKYIFIFVSIYFIS